MRPISPKKHLIDVSDPLLVYCNLTVRCGKQIRQSRFEVGISSTHLKNWATEDEFFSARDTCQKCLRTPAQIPEGAIEYLTYGLVDIDEEKAYRDWREAS